MQRIASEATTKREQRSVHTPVLAGAVVRAFEGQAERHAGGWLVDATVGAGGHAAALLDAIPGLRLLGLDQDPEILPHAERALLRFGERARLVRARMSHLREALDAQGIERVVGVLADLGASSLQLDRGERGFSFLHDGPLDMRMDPTRDRTAADVVNTWDEEDLADLFFYEGGERRSRAAARAIVGARRRALFLRTVPLADAIAHALGGRESRLHPATKIFQALRRAVNEEGEELLALLDGAQERLADGGALAVISFHSGEDAAVKRFVAAGAALGRWRLLSKKPLGAERDERRSNSRARSARLRAALRVRPDDARPSSGSGGEARR